jgi:hypothetical protein
MCAPGVRVASGDVFSPEAIFLLHSTKLFANIIFFQKRSLRDFDVSHLNSRNDIIFL